MKYLQLTNEEVHSPTFAYTLSKKGYHFGIEEFAWTCGEVQRGSQVNQLGIMKID